MFFVQYATNIVVLSQPRRRETLRGNHMFCVHECDAGRMFSVQYATLGGLREDILSLRDL
jgi:hypothetical protein